MTTFFSQLSQDIHKNFFNPKPLLSPMAYNTFRLYCVLGLLSLVSLLIQNVGATQFKVGGSAGWAPNSFNYNQWAEKHRFQDGDSLLFQYRTDTDSLLQVNENDYNNCNTDEPIGTFHDGNTSFKLKKAGRYYFISGNRDNCLKNEKMIVKVLSDKNHKSAASFLSLSFAIPIGAFLGSSILLTL